MNNVTERLKVLDDEKFDVHGRAWTSRTSSKCSQSTRATVNTYARCFILARDFRFDSRTYSLHASQVHPYLLRMA